MIEACGNSCGRLTGMRRAQKEIKHLKHQYEADTVTKMWQTDVKPHHTPNTHTHTGWDNNNKKGRKKKKMTKNRKLPKQQQKQMPGGGGGGGGITDLIKEIHG